ncbi:3,5-dihydroxyphenylacetyl-CoA synthase [subsurface metagenome]
MNQPKIISIGYSLPQKSYTQREVFDVLGYPQHFWRIFRDSGIEKRHFYVEPLHKIKQMTWQEMTEKYVEGAIELSKEAIIRCLDGRRPRLIGCLVFCSCSGFCPGPTIAHHLVKELGLPPDVYITNIISQGCESGFPGLKRAFDFTAVTGKLSLVIACELCSCTYFPEPDGRPDPSNHFELARSNVIFADAASCALVGFDDDWRHPLILDTETYTNTDYLNDLGFVWREGRLRVLLSKRVPDLAPLVVKPAVDAVLERNNLTVNNIAWFVIHAAGSTVIDNIRDALGIAEEKVTLSRKTLRLVGNTSSTSVGITGKMLMGEKIEPGDYALVLSIGPGMTGGGDAVEVWRLTR